MPEPPSASRSATTAVRSSAPCWKGWRSGSATPSSSCAHSAWSPGRPGSHRRQARSDLWRIVATVLELPLERTAAEEGAAFGAALLGEVTAGVFADVHEAVAATVRVRDIVEPEPEWVRPYADAYRRFGSLYPALRPLEDK